MDLIRPMRTAVFSCIAGLVSLIGVSHADTTSAANFRKAEDHAVFLLKEPRFQPPNGWHWGTLRNADGARLRYGWCETGGSPHGTVVLLPGFQSPIEGFYETARDFRRLGFDVWMFDWRGQGGSDRWLPNRQMTNSTGFDHDERDLVQFLSQIVRERGPLFLVGESFGGHIGLRLLHDHPNIVSAAAFSSPAIAFHTGTTAPWLVRLSAWGAVTLGYGDRYAINQSDWLFDPGAGGPKDDTSDDRDRALAAQAWLLTNPQLRQGGATWAYVDEFYGSSDMEMAPGWMGTIKTPVIIGEVDNDMIAIAPLMTISCREMKNCSLRVFSHTKHALFKDRDAVRGTFIAAIARFFAEHGASEVSSSTVNPNGR